MRNLAKLGLVFSPRCVSAKRSGDVVAYETEKGELLGLGALEFGGIGETPVMPIDLAGKTGAGLVGISANGDDGLHVAVQKLSQLFGAMPG